MTVSQVRAERAPAGLPRLDCLELSPCCTKRFNLAVSAGRGFKLNWDLCRRARYESRVVIASAYPVVRCAAWALSTTLIVEGDWCGCRRGPR